MKRTATTPAVRRSNGQYSRQPRFSQATSGSIFAGLMTFIKRTTEQLEIPDYIPYSMPRDQWLQEHWALEPHWAGVVNQTVLVDSSRAWTFTGGRNQVRRFSNVLHNADGGKGWRYYFRRESAAYRLTDMGSNTEWGRPGAIGPIQGIYHLDSSKCVWTGFDREMPPDQMALLDRLIVRRDNLIERGGPEKAVAEYQQAITELTKAWAVMEYHAGGETVYYPKGQFFNVSSMPSPLDEYNGLGYCQTSRAWDLVRLFYAVLAHDQELVGARMPKGILFLHNVSETQWADMLASRADKLDGMNRLYYGGLQIIATEGGETPDGKLLALSQLPANFDRETFINQTMYGYALVCGYDPTEFWPVSSGALGRGRETDIQHRKASAKGALEFPQGWADRFNRELPPTLAFEFEVRDAEGELLDAEIAQAWANVAKTLNEAGATFGPPLLDRQLTLKLLAENSHILNPDDVEIMQEAVATDESDADATERAMLKPQVRRAIERYPDEPIVQYSWPRGVERVIWARGSDALEPRAWARPGFKEKLRQELQEVARQDEPEILYESPDGDVIITSDDVARAVADWNRTMPDEAIGLLEAESVE